MTMGWARAANHQHLHVCYFSEPLIHIRSLKSHSNPVREVCFLCFTDEQTGTERLQNIPEITQVEGSSYSSLSPTLSYMLFCKESQPLNCKVALMVTLPAGLLCGWSVTAQVNNQSSVALAP